MSLSHSASARHAARVEGGFRHRPQVKLYLIARSDFDRALELLQEQELEAYEEHVYHAFVRSQVRILAGPSWSYERSPRTRLDPCGRRSGATLKSATSAAGRQGRESAALTAPAAPSDSSSAKAAPLSASARSCAPSRAAPWR